MNIMKQGDNPPQTDTNVAATGSTNLNTSFSAMNNSLSQKWVNINKKASNVRDGGTGNQQMSSIPTSRFTSSLQQPQALASQIPQTMYQSVGAAENKAEPQYSNSGFVTAPSPVP